MDKSHQVTSLVMNLRLDQEEEQASSVTGPSAAEQMQCSFPVTAPLAHRAPWQSLASVVQHLKSSRQYIQNIIYWLSTSVRSKMVWKTMWNWFIENKQTNRKATSPAYR